MDLNQLAQVLREDTLWVVFLNVLLQQLGMPVPAVPTMLLAGSLADSPEQILPALGAAVVASVLADLVWYFAGQIFGYRVLSGLCKLSINPASCVSQTEARFVRWGVVSLVVAKFIPGFSTVAPPIAGALRMGLPGFLLASAIGAALWAGLAMAAGWMLREQVRTAIALLEKQAGSVALLALALAGLWLAWKFWQKAKFRKFATVPHITPEELLDAMQSEQSPMILDLRGATMIAQTGPLPGTIIAEHDRLLDAVASWPKSRPVVTLCACPEDAGAIQAARHLLQAGYLSVRPLAGGYDAWQASGLGGQAAR